LTVLNRVLEAKPSLKGDSECKKGYRPEAQNIKNKLTEMLLKRQQDNYCPAQPEA
jgi:hypothetical protein